MKIKPLPWLHYRWSTTDRTSILSGNISFDSYPSELTLRQRCLGAAASFAKRNNIPYDPFNVQMMIVRVQEESKQEWNNNCQLSIQETLKLLQSGLLDDLDPFGYDPQY